MNIVRRVPVSINVKSTRKKPKALGSISLVHIPETILGLHPNADLLVDYIYIQSIILLYTISSNQFRTIESVRDKAKPNM